VLPVGISFYTFQSIAYSLDIYLRRAEPTRSLLDFALFVTFFPHLVAGPIVRPTLLIPQFEQPRRASREQLIWGLWLMTFGLFEKVVLADGFLAPAADATYRSTRDLTLLDAWTGALAFSGQIFFDFAGYSLTAIGAACALGFTLNDNFHCPYAAMGFSDFWRRWHVSLSGWLRDYLYVPLGGNRRGRLRTYANLMITMLLGGLWHGASWTFVAWGALHGALLGVERWLCGDVGHRWRAEHARHLCGRHHRLGLLQGWQLHRSVADAREHGRGNDGPTREPVLQRHHRGVGHRRSHARGAVADAFHEPRDAGQRSTRVGHRARVELHVVHGDRRARSG
jgi:alginate O-acetyltransferase complex protein AlgI